MYDRTPEASTSRPIATVALLVCLGLLGSGSLSGCKTPNAPHFPIPDQSLSTPAPAGHTRVVFMNTNFVSEAAGAGPIRIQLDGRQIPSVWPERYVQVFVEPGEYDLLIEQSFGFFWKVRDRLTVGGDELLISLYKSSFGFRPRYEIVDDLPSDFDEAFRPGRHPESW